MPYLVVKPVEIVGFSVVNKCLKLTYLASIQSHKNL